MKRILTGDRPTGKLHLGHYVGSLQNRVNLHKVYDTYIIIANVQALTTHFNQPELIQQSIYDVAIDNLSVGLEPDHITMFLQSQISAIAELTVLYSMLVSVNALRHNPTIKSEAKQYGYNELSYGFLGYPVNQAADITFCGAQLVPVGSDQLPHIEQARKIVRRFNALYGKGDSIITLPQARIMPRLIGLDGNTKMGKSLHNAIYLSDNTFDVKAKIKSAKTDTRRIHTTDKGHPDSCVISSYHKAFNQADYDNICEMCINADIGCVACKKQLTHRINTLLAPFREKRAYYEERKNRVRDLILSGSIKANQIGNETVSKAKEAMKINL